MVDTGTADTADTAAKGRYAPVNGLELYYEIHGRGRPLVLLHGGMLTIDLSFGPLIPTLAESHRVIAVELQGHGHTADTGRAMTMDNLADDVVGLLVHLGADNADLLGFSLGGMVAMAVARRRPDLVRRLVLVSAPMHADGFHPGTRPHDADEGSARMPTAADGEAWEREYRRVAPDPGHLSELMAKAATLVSAYEGWTADELRAVEAPVLILVGDTDFVRLEHAVELLDVLADARLAVLPAATHMDMTRRPEQVLAMVVPFLADPDDGTGA